MMTRWLGHEAARVSRKSGRAGLRFSRRRSALAAWLIAAYWLAGLAVATPIVIQALTESLR